MPATRPPSTKAPPAQTASIIKTDGRRLNADSTRAALQREARKLFGKQGYDATALSQICEAAGATTGALYHHFGDKKGLFAAVAEALDADLVTLAGGASAHALAAGGDAWDAFLAAIDAFLKAGLSAPGRRIGLTDAPAVLGADVWLAIRERHGLGAMVRTVTALQAAGHLPPGDPVRRARLVLGLLYGAVEALPKDAAQLPRAMADTRQLVHTMLGAMRVQNTPAG